VLNPPAEEERAEGRGSKVLALVFFGLLAYVCARTLHSGVLQIRTSDYPSVTASITRYVWEDAGDAGRVLAVAYRYQIGKRTYLGERIRFIPRPFRIGLADGTARAQTWGAGKQVKIFYDPVDPQNALLDKGLTTGDWLFLSMVLAVLVASVAGIAKSAISLSRPRR